MNEKTSIRSQTIAFWKFETEEGSLNLAEVVVWLAGEVSVHNSASMTATQPGRSQIALD
jgi:hypothetical protein